MGPKALVNRLNQCLAESVNSNRTARLSSRFADALHMPRPFERSRTPVTSGTAARGSRPRAVAGGDRTSRWREG